MMYQQIHCGWRAAKPGGTDTAIRSKSRRSRVYSSMYNAARLRNAVEWAGDGLHGSTRWFAGPRFLWGNAVDGARAKRCVLPRNANARLYDVDGAARVVSNGRINTRSRPRAS